MRSERQALAEIANWVKQRRRRAAANGLTPSADLDILDAFLADVQSEPESAGGIIDRDALVRPAEGAVMLTREEASACAWALDHLVAKHDYDALRSRDGSRVDLRVLADQLEAAS